MSSPSTPKALESRRNVKEHKPKDKFVSKKLDNTLDVQGMLNDQQEQEDRLKEIMKELKVDEEKKSAKRREKADFIRQIKADHDKKDENDRGSSSSFSISKQLEIRELTFLNPRFMKWMNITIAVLNYVTAMHVMWLAIAEEALIDHLIELDTWTCPEPHDIGDLLVRFVLAAWAFSSFALLWAEDKETAPVCFFWIAAKAFQIIAYALVSSFERRGHAGLPALSLLLSPLNLILDLFCFAATILYYYHLVGHHPVRDRKRQARISEQVNNEFFFAGSQTFFQRKLAVEWVCKQQAHRCVKRLINIRRKVLTNATVKFEPESFQVRLDTGFLKFMDKTHIISYKYFESLQGKDLLERLAKFKSQAEEVAPTLSPEDEQRRELEDELKELEEEDNDDLGLPPATDPKQQVHFDDQYLDFLE